jgi:hypothetical protein
MGVVIEDGSSCSWRLDDDTDDDACCLLWIEDENSNDANDDLVDLQ